jgi:penicillin-binding protein A
VDRQIRWLAVVLVACFVILFLQLNRIQVLQASKLANAPGNVRTTEARFSEPRGVIQSADGVVLARSVPTNDIFKYQRQYPEGALFAQITGYFSLIYGTDGVERTYNADLNGKTLPIRDIKDIFTSRTVTENVTLTLTKHLQQVAATALGNQVGAVVALDPRNGSVLAMYSNPSYDPNPLAAHNSHTENTAWSLYQLAPSQPMLARAYRRSYAPGSTFKVVTAAAVLDHRPDLAKKSYPSQSSIALPNSSHRLSNFAGETCGGTLPELLTISCDTGFGQIGLDMAPGTDLAAEANAFGFNQHPPLDLPAVAASTFPPASAFTNDLPALAFSAIGQQNVSATALQMALVASAVANHGIVMGPHVMAQIHDNQGRLVRSWQPTAWIQATSANTAQTLTLMMANVANNGTAQGVFNIPGVQVAAKTGTAQTGGSAGSNAWMIAFAPAAAPTVAVAVVVPAQPGLSQDATGAAAAGPIADKVLAAALGK